MPRVARSGKARTIKAERWRKSPRESLEAVRLEKLRRIAGLGLDPWGQRFDGHQAIAEVRALPVPKPAEGEAAEPGPTVRVAGRIMLRRGQGKVVFLELRDWTERIQVFVGKKQVGDAAWELVDLLDLGDLIGVDGTLGYTKTGELTVFADRAHVPGQEPAAAAREVARPDRPRAALPAAVRRPVHQSRVARRPSWAGRRSSPRSARSWPRRASSRSRRRRCRPSPAAPRPGRSSRITTRSISTCSCGSRWSCYLKRLLVGGMERVFEIGRVYRNEGISPKHNPEFTMMEAYQAYGDYHAMMDLTEALICGAIEAIGGGFQRPWGETTIDFTPPWPRRTYAELLAEHAGVDPADFAVDQGAGRGRPGIATAGKDPDVVTSELFEELVEDKLDRPDLRDRLSGRDLPAHQAEGVEPRGRRAVRALRRRAWSWPTPTPS